MIEETKTQEEVIKRHKFCDVCGNEISSTMACSRAVCECCGKDLCEKCIGHEDSSCGDYRIVYCKRCWEIGEPYRAVIDELENRIECGYADWQNACRGS